MGSFFSDMFGIEGAGQSLADALLAAQVNATLELRNVTLTAINYVKSFSPLISLTMLFLILLLIVSTVFILNRVLLDLNVSAFTRQCVVTVIAFLLYIWLFVLLVMTAMMKGNTIYIVLAAIVRVGFLVTIGLCLWFKASSNRKKRASPQSNRNMNVINLDEQY